MKYMGAGALLYGLVLPACKRTNDYLVPWNDSPEWSLPGLSTSYATCMPSAAGAVPMLAVCREGRPLKLEAQPWLTETPGLGAVAQASILELYDPARSREKLFNGRPVTEDEFNGAFAAWARKTANGGRVAFVFGENESPLRRQLVDEITRRNPQARFFTWEPLSRRESRRACADVYGEGVVALARFSQARRVLSLDCDFLGHDVQGYTGDFMKGRLPEGPQYGNPAGDYQNLNRLYVAEGRFSLTGGLADERLPVRPSRMAALITTLAAEVGRLTGSAMRTAGDDFTTGLTADQTIWIKRSAADLCAHSGQSVVLLGSHYPAMLHKAVLAINAALNAGGITLHFLQGEPEIGEDLFALTDALERGELDTVFVLCAANPAVDFPDAKRLAAALARPGVTSVRLSLYRDETADACTWHIPAAHYLESWGVERDLPGRFCYMQPVITPLYAGVSEAELIHGLLHSRGILRGSPADGQIPSPVYQRVRRCFDPVTRSGDRTSAWADALRTGVSPEAAYPRLVANPYAPGADLWQECRDLARRHAEEAGNDDIEIQYIADYSVLDGRHAHNAWLRECPDPITGGCWEPVAHLSPATCARLGGPADARHPLDLCLAEKKIPNRMAALPIPGTADGLIVIPLGYAGRTAFDSARPFSLYRSGYRLTDFPVIDASCLSLKLRKQAPALPPVALDEAPVPILTPGQAADRTPTPPPDIRAEVSSDPLHQWAMCIDLTLCIGCNACVIACQAENNIPVVGPGEVAAGRLMHWIRIDRYFVRQEDGSHAAFLPQPVACQQCESAPCESVCPVNATTHTGEGINAMVYPRCWGTRYCAANCPYKARRFNFFDYAKASDEATRLQRNPHVTVRSRGVMEKCTYCVQRIEDAKVRHKARLTTARQGGGPLAEAQAEAQAEELRLPAHAVKTACQMACPAGAITFGNLLQQGDSVNMARRSGRCVTLLGELGTRPRTSYLARVRNASAQGDSPSSPNRAEGAL